MQRKCDGNTMQYSLYPEYRSTWLDSRYRMLFNETCRQKNTLFRLGMSTYRTRGVAVSVIKHEVTPTVLGHAARSNTNPASNSLRERRILSLEAAEHGRFANDSQKESYSPPRAWKTTSNRMTVIAEKRVSRVRGKMDPWTMRFGCRN